MTGKSPNNQNAGRSSDLDLGPGSDNTSSWLMPSITSLLWVQGGVWRCSPTCSQPELFHSVTRKPSESPDNKQACFHWPAVCLSWLLRAHNWSKGLLSQRQNTCGNKKQWCSITYFLWKTLIYLHSCAFTSLPAWKSWGKIRKKSTRLETYLSSNSTKKV